jgi:hypothetical protein
VHSIRPSKHKDRKDCLAVQIHDNVLLVSRPLLPRLFLALGNFEACGMGRE